MDLMLIAMQISIHEFWWASRANSGQCSYRLRSRTNNVGVLTYDSHSVDTAALSLGV